jgi:Rad3-related DNA helicase
VPHAALRLRQALTGLAWSQQTRNAIVLFDRRLGTRGYGPVLLGALPQCTVRNEALSRLADQVAEWVGGEAGRG